VIARARARAHGLSESGTVKRCSDHVAGLRNERQRELRVIGDDYRSRRIADRSVQLNRKGESRAEKYREAVMSAFLCD